VEAEARATKWRERGENRAEEEEEREREGGDRRREGGREGEGDVNARATANVILYSALTLDSLDSRF
jgi:hypothetical protein